MAGAEDYILGAQDKLKVRVFEWRPVTGTAFEWTPLNGEFVVSAAGNISLPIIGSVHAAGLTLDQISESIGEHLKEQVGMQKRPNASVEVAEYRPFFITGLVSKPGKYSYSPGLTVIQALSMAGGSSGNLDPNLVGLQRDLLSNQGDMRVLETERLGLLARQARLDAIIKNQSSVTFPPELNKYSGQPDVVRMVREEQDLFATRQRSVAAQIDALNQGKILATNQIEALKTKASSLAKQIELATKDMANVTKLVSAGLTVSARSLGASQNLSDLESRNLDVALATLKAQQDVAKADQDIADASNRYRVDALTEAADVRERLSANAEKARTARSMVDSVEQQFPIAAGALVTEEQTSFQTTIDRQTASGITTIDASDYDLIDPGDVIRVQRRTNAAVASSLRDGNSATVLP